MVSYVDIDHPFSLLETFNWKEFMYSIREAPWEALDRTQPSTFIAMKVEDKIPLCKKRRSPMQLLCLVV